jgi:DNA primase
MTTHMSFKTIKASVSLLMVLTEYYGLASLIRRGDKLIGPCPVHGGNNERAFHANLRENLWFCFTGCGRGGDQLTLVSLRDGISLTQAAERLATFFLVSSDPRPPPVRLPVASSAKPVRINSPLTFRLTLDHAHPSLTRDRRLSSTTIRHFGVGYATHGMLRGMIAIPLHNRDGQLVAYAGRRLREEDIARFGKYRFPAGLHRDALLYNLHRLALSASPLFVVEGFFSAMTLFERGYPDVVATMGCRLASEQAELLVALKRPIVLLFDGDNAGRAGARAAAELLKTKLPVMLVSLPDGAEPEDLSEQTLNALRRSSPPDQPPTTEGSHA